METDSTAGLEATPYFQIVTPLDVAIKKLKDKRLRLAKEDGRESPDPSLIIPAILSEIKHRSLAGENRFGVASAGYQLCETVDPKAHISEVPKRI